MFIIRAVNVYPGQIDHVLSGISGIGSEFQVHLKRAGDGKDYMTVKVERGKGASPGGDAACKKAVESLVKKQIMVSCECEICGYGELPRSERKTKRVFDTRED
jgi:phenylacetate-CoA ligase